MNSIIGISAEALSEIIINSTKKALADHEVETEELLSISEVAKHFKIHPRILYKAVADHSLKPSAQRRGTLYFRPSQFLIYINKDEK